MESHHRQPCDAGRSASGESHERRSGVCRVPDAADLSSLRNAAGSDRVPQAEALLRGHERVLVGDPPDLPLLPQGTRHAIVGLIGAGVLGSA